MYQNNIIGQTAPQQFNPALSPLQQARASGVVQEYKFISYKPKTQLKELKLVLKAEPKKFLGIKYGKKFNLKDRCVVCGTYCPKHASIYVQLEMLQQQILADKHGLEFSAFKPRMPKMLKGGPIKTLSKEDVMSLTSAGWFITPPALGDSKTATDEVIRLITEINIMTERLNHLMLKHNVQAQNELPQEEAKEELVKEA